MKGFFVLLFVCLLPIQSIIAQNAAVNPLSNPELSVSKTASVDTFEQVGDTITYAIVVENTGNVVISDIEIADLYTGDRWLIVSMEASQVETFAVDYIIRQYDMDNGGVENTVKAIGFDPEGNLISATDTETVTAIGLSAQFNVSKQANTQTYSTFGQVILYSIGVENAGNVTIRDIEATDDLTGDSWAAGSLAPGTIKTLTTIYYIRQQDLDTGMVTNTVNVSGKDHEDKIVAGSDTKVIQMDPDARNPELSTSKRADTPHFKQTGETITYAIRVENTGNLTIKDIDVMDELTGDAWHVASLPPGQRASFATLYQITQQDLDANLVINKVIATGADQLDVSVSSQAEEIIRIHRDALNPGLSLTKTANPHIYENAGDLITYSIVLENTGNITILDIDLEDPVTGDYWFIASLAPGDTETFTTMYTISMQDMDRGSVLNTATAGGSDAHGRPVIGQDEDEVYVIRVPRGLTPDGDFDNTLEIRGIRYFPYNTFKVYNRWGTLVYEASPYKNDWDGVPNRGRIPPEFDSRLPAGTYYYVLELHPDLEPMSGYIYLIK